MKVSKREIVLLVVLFIVICVFLYYRIYLNPITEEISALDTEIGVLETTLKDMEVKKVVVDNLRLQLNELQKESTEKLEPMMKSIDQPNMLMMMSGIIEGRGDETAYIFTRDYEEMDDCRLYTASVSFLTDYASLKEIIEGLENAPYINRVVMGAISSSGEGEEGYNLSVTLSVEFLVQNEDTFEDSYDL